MAKSCVFIFKGRRYTEAEFRQHMKDLSPEEIRPYVADIPDFRDALGGAEEAFTKKVFREIPGVTDAQAAKLLDAFQRDPGALPELLQAAIGHRRLAKALELWKAGLLSAPSTNVANMTGNAAEQGARVLEAGIASGIDRLIDYLPERFRGAGGRERFGGEAAALASGMGDRFGGSLSTLVDNYRRIFLKLEDKVIDPGSTRFEHQVGAVPGTLGKVARTSFRKLEAEDNFWKELINGGEIRRLSLRKASQELGSSATSKKLSARAAQIEREALDPAHAGHADMLKAVEESKLAGTFQDDPGELVKALTRMTQRYPVLGVVLPFVRTPANIAKMTIKRSPAGFVEAVQKYRAWQRGEISRGEAVDAISRPMLGTAILAGFSAYAMNGGMTGGGPTDNRERNALRNTGWQPYSFVFTGSDGRRHYVPYNRFEPVSALLGFAADLAEIKDQKKAGDIFDKALGSIAENLTSKTYLRGLSDAASLISRPQQFASSYVSNLAGTVVPTIIARGARAVDPVLRDTSASEGGITGIPERIGKTVLSRIPWGSTYLPSRRTATGEDIVRPGSALGRLAGPVQISSEKPGTELEKLMVDVGYVPGQPGREMTLNGRKLRLTDSEYAQLQEANKKAAQYIRQRIMKSSTFRRLDDLGKARELRRVFDRFRDDARGRIQRSPAFQRRRRAVATVG